MSQHYDAGQAGGVIRTPMAYYPPGTDLEAAEVYFDDEGTPAGHGDLIIGDAYNGAYDLEGTPAELRAYVADLAALLGLSIAPCARCGANLTDDSESGPDGVDGHWDGCPAVEDRCGECAAHSADPHGPGCKAAADAAEQDAPAQDKWRTANNGTSKRMWFLIRTDESVPVAERYHTNAAGDLIRYASDQNAQHVADRLNAEARRG
jgi:hypothetical protein